MVGTITINSEASADLDSLFKAVKHNLKGTRNLNTDMSTHLINGSSLNSGKNSTSSKQSKFKHTSSMDQILTHLSMGGRNGILGASKKPDSTKSKDS